MAAVSRLLTARAQQCPDRSAFIAGVDGRALSWGTIAAYADSLRVLARERKLAPRSRIAIVLDDPLVFTAVYLGVLAVGMTAVPIDPRLPPGELALALARLKVDVLATDQPEITPSLDREVWAADEHGAALFCPGATAVRPSVDAASRPAVLLASSGTTGAPKGIPLTEWQLINAAGRVAKHHRFSPTERGYTPLPLFHVNAQVMGLLATVVSGASLVVDRRFDAGAYWSRVAQWSPTWLNMVPAILATLLEQPSPPADLVARVRFARSASAPLPEATLRAFADHAGVSVLETYGMTEAAGQITANPLDPAARRVGSVGLPVGVGLTVLGTGGTPAGPGEEGMVALRGRQVIGQYLTLTEGGPETTRSARDASGWLLTGDLGWRDEAGFVTLAGRSDDVINRGGEKIHPQEIENVLLSHPAVRSAAVVGAPHERLGQVAVAFVTVIPGVDGDEGLAESLRRFCAQRLVKYKQPGKIEITEALPTGPTGKVLRRALRAELAKAGTGR